MTAGESFFQDWEYFAAEVRRTPTSPVWSQVENRGVVYGMLRIGSRGLRRDGSVHIPPFFIIDPLSERYWRDIFSSTSPVSAVLRDQFTSMFRHGPRGPWQRASVCAGYTEPPHPGPIRVSKSYILSYNYFGLKTLSPPLLDLVRTL